MYIVSACLLGENCKYDGGNNRNEEVIEFCKDKCCLKVCPERAGGLPCPRPASEYQGDRIVNNQGQDVTKEFEKGAKAELEKALIISGGICSPIEGAILKANSPSCGNGQIYDGTFSGTLVSGDGCFVKMLKERGIPVASEKEKMKW